MNIQRNEWTVFSIYQRHSPSISFADRSSNDLEDRDGNRIRHEVERKKNRQMRYRVLPTRREEGEIFMRKKDVFEEEKEGKQGSITKSGKRVKEVGYVEELT